jgi:hypothetical protein
MFFYIRVVLSQDFYERPLIVNVLTINVPIVNMGRDFDAGKSIFRAIGRVGP